MTPPRRPRRGRARPPSLRLRSTLAAERSRRKVANTSSRRACTSRSGSLITRPAASRTKPTGSMSPSSPRSALFSSPAVRRARIVQLHLGDRALEAQEQPPVGRGRVVDAVPVADEALPVAAQVEQRVPVRAVAAETGHLRGEHDADLTQRDARDQVLEARPVRGRRPAQAEVAVDHLDILLAPTEVERAPA